MNPLAMLLELYLEFMTLTVTAPGLCGGVIAVICVNEALITAALISSKASRTDGEKFPPLIVIGVPPVSGPA